MSAPLILGTNSIKDTGYNVANSCRFDSSNDEHMHITYSGASNRKTWTWSGWVKRTKTGVQTNFWSVGSANNTFGIIYISSNDDFTFYEADSGGTTAFLSSSQLFRDNSAWYHILFSLDTTQSTANNRQRLWVNGTEVTSFGNRTNPSLNADLKINSAIKHYLGGTSTGLSNLEWDGYMAEVVFLDGTAVTGATDFGEFDEDSPTIWKPKDVSGLTFGTNGFYLDFENSGSLGADVSGNSNNLTVSNLTSVDQSTDTCTNNFATLNPLTNEDTNITLSQGNLDYVNSKSGDETVFASIGVSSGKWYFETKYTDTSNYMDIGVGSANELDITTPRADMEMAGYYMIQLRTSSPGTRAFDNGSAGSGLGNSALNDINMFAIDMDNNKFYAGKNGTWYSSGDPANNSNPLITMDDGYTTLIPAVCGKFSSAVSVNFGSPSYTISSGNSDAEGHGNFEYAVPSGYFALCTKNLAEYG
tara:strand:+ start:73 stop:1491 length:1419 start_codon:yes stop_codon:yes gene_type:complete